MFKSIKTGVVAIILIGTAIIAKAQKVFDQGTITYGIEYLLTDAQKGQINADLLPSESKVDFNNNTAKVQTDMGIAMLKVINDAAVGKAVLLVEIPMMQKKYAVKVTTEELDRQNGNLKYSDFKPTGEQQKIAGYNAEKYTYKDNNGGSYELWATKEIRLPKGAIPSGFSELDATALKFVNIQDGLKTMITLKNIIAEKTGPFSLEIPQGYEEKTFADLKAMQQAVGQ